MDLSRPGKPMDNAMIESFYGSFRNECLNLNWFLPIEDAREKIEMWRQNNNEFRAHSSLGDLTPQKFADKFMSVQGEKTIFLNGLVIGQVSKMVQHICRVEHEERFYKMKIIYFDEDRYVYWTMGVPIEETTIINRYTKENTCGYRLKMGTLPGDEA